MLYGSSEHNLADQLDIPVNQAKDIIDGIMEGFPGLKEYVKSCHHEAMTKGYKDTNFGYRRQLDEVITKYQSREEAGKAGMGLRYKHALNSSQNHPIQSDASIMGWIVASHIQEEFLLQGMKSRMIGNVHDSVEMDIYPGELPDALRIVEYHTNTIVNNIYDWLNLVRIDYDCELGISWGMSGELKKVSFNEDGTTSFKFVGGDVFWDYIKTELDIGYDYEIVSFEEGRSLEDEHNSKNPLPQPTKEVKVEVLIKNPIRVKEMKSKYLVGNGKLDSLDKTFISIMDK